MDFVRIIPAQQFTGLPAPDNRLYAFYADAFSLHGRTYAECYQLVKGRTLPPKAGYWQKEIRTPFAWRTEGVREQDSPLLKVTVAESGNVEYADYPLEWLERTMFVVLGVTLPDATKDLDPFPATWRALAYILSDSRRMNAETQPWKMTPGDYAGARLHAQFCASIGDRGLLATRQSKEQLGLTNLDRLPEPQEEIEYYGYLSLDSLFTDQIAALFGISYRCWHGCGYLGRPGFPMFRFFWLRNQMSPQIHVSVVSGRDRFFHDPSQEYT